MILLVGEALNGDGKPLSGRIGKRLASLSGLTFEEYLKRTVRVNLLAEQQEAAGKGHAFNMNEAVWAASLLKVGSAKKHDAVLLLGKRVAAAFGMRQSAYLQWYELHGVKYAVIPHPSGVNRWYNDAENVAELRRFLSALLKQERS